MDTINVNPSEIEINNLINQLFGTIKLKKNGIINYYIVGNFGDIDVGKPDRFRSKTQNKLIIPIESIEEEQKYIDVYHNDDNSINVPILLDYSLMDNNSIIYYRLGESSLLCYLVRQIGKNEDDWIALPIVEGLRQLYWKKIVNFDKYDGLEIDANLLEVKNSISKNNRGILSNISMEMYQNIKNIMGYYEYKSEDLSGKYKTITDNIERIFGNICNREIINSVIDRWIPSNKLVTIKTKLYAHQEYNVKRIINDFRNDIRVRLDCSESGTGKTLTTLSILAELINCHYGRMVLIVVPNNELIEHWKSEINKHTIGFNVVTELDNINNFKNNVENMIVIIKRTTLNCNKYNSTNIKWLCVVCDEEDVKPSSNNASWKERIINANSLFKLIISADIPILSWCQFKHIAEIITREINPSIDHKCNYIGTNSVQYKDSKNTEDVWKTVEFNIDDYEMWIIKNKSNYNDLLVVADNINYNYLNHKLTDNIRNINVINIDDENTFKGRDDLKSCNTLMIEKKYLNNLLVPQIKARLDRIGQNHNMLTLIVVN